MVKFTQAMRSLVVRHESREPRVAELSTKTNDSKCTLGARVLRHRSFALGYLMVITV